MKRVTQVDLAVVLLRSVQNLRKPTNNQEKNYSWSQGTLDGVKLYVFDQNILWPQERNTQNQAHPTTGMTMKQTSCQNNRVLLIL